MSLEQRFPRTVQRWHQFIGRHGVSNRPFSGESDLSDHALHPDPEDIKPERVALSAIIATRAYQRAKKTLLSQEKRLSYRTGKSLNPLERLKEKSQIVSAAFSEAMADAILEDEAYARTLPRDHPLARIYQRLEDLTQPTINAGVLKRKPMEIKDAKRTIPQPSDIFLQIYIPFTSLPSNTHSMIGRIISLYIRQTKNQPNSQTVLRIMANSYDSFIKATASLHMADFHELERVEARLAKRRESINVLADDALHLSPTTLRFISEFGIKTRRTRSRTTTCGFLADTTYMQDFLDEPADFEDPLKDAFNLYMRFLSAN